MTRVVITGMGVISANAHGLDEFETALKNGVSGIRYYEKLKELGFSCQVGGIPQGVEELKREYFSEEALMAMNSSMLYASIAAMDCWKDAGFSLPTPSDETIHWETGAVIGTGIGGIDTLGEKVIPLINAGKVRRLGSTAVEQTMGSAASARIGGFLGLGGQVTSNSSACTTGTEALVNAYYMIKEGRVERVLAGGSEGSSHYIWGSFDAMRGVLSSKYNDQPEKASRPMSASAAGFVPSSGAGILMLESLESAKKRGAKIYAEILGGHVNCGGQRNGGSITAPNPEGVVRCVRKAIENSGIRPQDIEAINGHLTATMADPIEIKNWQRALECSERDFPYINSTKSLIGHGLGAAGGIECVAAALQLKNGFLHGSVNCEDLHPELEAFSERIVRKTIEKDVRILAKASFGFGDVNGMLIMKKWEG
ncbi:beta-ketoacyl-[acyl-carrier-protein] synthase family protein [bacterium]|nr:beta-ketoacyl-[acyl-carrier-protein] synthase family protein [bacterium]MBU1919003.1 beta-ketoacyl-[acyl-carrier-protein] synthase family protein [bacterium]